MYYNILSLRQKAVHEEDYAEEEHGQPAANLCDNGEIAQVSARDGFVKRCLQRAKNVMFDISNQEVVRC